MNLLSASIVIATEAHDGQIDKIGEPYILHPLRVMQDELMTSGLDELGKEIVRSIAVLHDVIEDTEYDAHRLHDRLYKLMVQPPKADTTSVISIVVDNVEAFSKREDEEGFIGYGQFVARVRDFSDYAKRVKISDIHDNSDRKRIIYLPGKEREYLKSKYQHGLFILRQSPES